MRMKTQQAELWQSKEMKRKPKVHRRIIFDQNAIEIDKNCFKVDSSDQMLDKVYFPYRPYSQQEQLIKSLMTTVLSSQNALVESPTGTGKTLCILASTLSALAFEQRSVFDPDPPQHKIYYLTRTHSQITQVISELKRLTWFKLKVNIIASREHLCINKNLSQLKGRQLDRACQDICKQKLCKYKEDMNDKGVSKLLKDVLTVDELKQKCSKQFTCPFYYSKAACDQSELTIMPFNYMLDWSMFEKNKFTLKDSIIIFDEAHNVDSMAEEGSSLEIDTDHLLQSQAEIQNLSKASKCRYLHKNFQPEADYSHKIIQEVLNFTVTMKNILKSFSGKEKVLSNLHNILSTLRSLTTYTNPKTQQIYEGINLENYEQILLSFDRIIKIFNSKAVPGEQTLNFYQTLRKIFHLLDHDPERIQSEFYVSIQTNTSGKVSLKFNCLNPSLCFERILKEKPRSVILCSGTLGNLDLLERELGVKFHNKIVLPSFIKDQQISAKILAKLSKNQQQQYDFSFQKKSRLSQYQGLSEELANLQKLDKKGIVVAFSTYEIMSNALKVCLGLKRKIFYESKNSDGDSIFKAYSKEALQNGAFLFIIMKGRFAEGINFSGDLCRCLVLVGIPFLPLMDNRVRRKKELIEKRDGRETAEKWYLCQTFKTVNQVIGRVIRSKEDFGSILLVDQRFARKEIFEQLPGWLKKSIQASNNNKGYLNQFMKFFQNEQWNNYSQRSSLIGTQECSPFQRTTKARPEIAFPSFSTLLGQTTPAKRKCNGAHQRLLRLTDDDQFPDQNASNQNSGLNMKVDCVGDVEKGTKTQGSIRCSVKEAYEPYYPWLSVNYFIDKDLLARIEATEENDELEQLGISQEQIENSKSQLIPKIKRKWK